MEKDSKSYIPVSILFDIYLCLRVCAHSIIRLYTRDYTDYSNEEHIGEGRDNAKVFIRFECHSMLLRSVLFQGRTDDKKFNSLSSDPCQ